MRKTMAEEGGQKRVEWSGLAGAERGGGADVDG